MKRIIIIVMIFTAQFLYSETLGFVSTDVLNVRSGPDLGSPVIGAFSQGELVKILSKSVHNTKIDNFDTGWYYIQKDDLYGWVYAAFVVPVSDSKAAFDYVCQKSSDGTLEQYYLKIEYIDMNNPGRVRFTVYKEVLSKNDIAVYFNRESVLEGDSLFSGKNHNENAGGESSDYLTYDPKTDTYFYRAEKKGWKDETFILQKELLLHKKLSTLPPVNL